MLSTGSSIIMKDMKIHTSAYISWNLATPHQKCWGTIWLSLESRKEKPNSKWSEGDNLSQEGGNCQIKQRQLSLIS